MSRASPSPARPRRLRRIAPVCLLVGLAAAGATAAQTVAIEVRIILASNDPRGGIDAGLGSLAPQLRQTLGYTSYQLLNALVGEVAPDRPWRTMVPGGRSLEIAMPGTPGRGIALLVRMSAGASPLVNTTVRLARGGPPVLVGGPPFQSGVLLIAISAR